MSEERFDHLEKMMEQLIKLVGSNNASIEEMRQDINSTIATKDDIKNLKEADQALLGIAEKTYRELEQFSETQKLHAVWLRRLAADSAQNAAEIELLKKAR